jgi:predicted DCC family thiol-disulfide oxidoreductase YuxK
MNNGWTGGQYSLFRGILGLYLLVHFVALIPWGAETFSNAGVLPDRDESPLIHAFPNILAVADSPAIVTLLLVGATLASILFSLGKWDRVSAVWIWYVLACLFGRNPLTANPSLPFVGWMLLAHVFLAPSPYGALSARGRTDPGNGWKFDRWIFLAAWIVLSLAYSYSGYSKLISPSWIDGTAFRDILENPLARDTIFRGWILALPDAILKLFTWAGLFLELAFLPLVLFRRIRPWLWAALLGMHFSLVVLIDFADLSLGMIMIHLFTFDPAWLKPGRQSEEETVILFYDGHCGLCHRFVRFVMAEDIHNSIQFAPLQGKAFQKAASKETRDSLPDSLVIKTKENHLLTESDGVLHMLVQLGGIWKFLGTTGRFLPLKLRNVIYRLVARNRKKVFAAPADTCPVIPARYRDRFQP